MELQAKANSQIQNINAPDRAQKLEQVPKRGSIAQARSCMPSAVSQIPRPRAFKPPRLYRGRLGHQRASFAEIGPCRLSSLMLPRRGRISSLQDWSFEVRINRKPFTNTRHLMHKEQQDDNKTKEIRIIQDNGIWKVINHEGRTLETQLVPGPRQRKVWPYSNSFQSTEGAGHECC